jgi:CubicO group peptidase (beta-lactamase class C family)
LGCQPKGQVEGAINPGAVSADEQVQLKSAHVRQEQGSAHVQPGQPFLGGHQIELGYGYQWWIPAGGRGDFTAIGVYNQFVYVDQSRDVVIVKLSANRTYGTTADQSTNRELETIDFLRSIAAAV